MPSGDFEALKRKIPDHIREISYVKQVLKSSGWINSYYDVVRKLIGDKYYKEAIDILIEIQRQTKRNGIVDLIREIPLNDSICHYMEFVLDSIKNESEEEIYDTLNYIWVSYLLEYSKMLGYKSEGVVPWFHDRFDVEKEAEIRGIEYALKISNIIVNSFPNPSDSFRKKNEWTINGIIEMFVLNNNIERAEEITNDFLADDSYKKKSFYSAFISEYDDQKKYGKAIPLARWILDKVVIKKEKSEDNIKKAKLFFINLLALSKSYEEAEREYRELGELQKAAEMYERAGMKQKAIEIYTEIEREKWGGISPEDQEIKCPNCGEELEPDWDVCPRCETVFYRKKRCTSCGRELKPQWKICPDCKEKI